ncbi:GTP-binding protein [Streptomyces sp. NBC_01727]|uniref:GTP-binding protein n=1 Tax=Streptomyces sp. NBC_01727 TaxID=2975924 RepID=UPI002E11C0D6|nr:ATP/GTP-binding protein [Streptomyces sp. NBC_01727]
MAFADSRPSDRDPAYLPHANTQVAKLVVAGGFGVGKTTLIRAVSEVRSLHTEEIMTAPSAVTDSLEFTPEKTTTTVNMDFGRLTLDTGNLANQPVLYLFGTPGQARFEQTWKDTTYGAHGGLVLLDLRRPEASYEALDLIERSGMPYAVAVNQFPGAPFHSDPALRTALNLADDTPLTHCNALDRESSIDALITLVQHAVHVYRREAAS